MAGTITTRISINGAEDIRKKLEALGVAGEKAFKQIQAAAAKPIIDPAQIDKSKQAFDQLAQAAQKTGNAIEQAGQQTKAAGQAIGTSLATAATRFTIAATAIAFAISAVVRSLTTGAGETAQTISDQADRLGLTIQQWIGLRRSVDAARGSTEEFANSVAPLLRNLNQLDAESGRSFQTFANGATVAILSAGKLSEQSKQLVAVLQKFGVRRDIIDKGSVAIMQELARIIDGMPEGTAKAAAGIQFFGAKWRDAVAALVVGFKSVGNAEAELDNKRAASRELTTEEAAAAKKAADQWTDLGNAIRAVKDKVGAFFAPGSEARAKWLTDMVDDARMLLTTFLQLDKAGRAGFLQNLMSGESGAGGGAAGTAFRILVALGQQLAGVWDVLASAGGKLMGVFDGIVGIFEGITGSQVAAFFITATIAAVGLALALKGIALVLTPLTLLLSAVFGPFGPLLLAAAAAAVLFWDKLKAGAQTVAALIPQELAAIGESIKKLFAGDFSGFWDQFSTAAVAAFQKIGAAAEADQGVVGNVFRGIKQIIADLPGTIELIIGAFIALGKAATGVADAINAVFGTKLTGTDIAALAIIGQMTGAFGLLAAAAVIASNAVTVLGAAFGWVVSAVAWIAGISVGWAAVVVVLALVAAALIALNWDAIKAKAIAAWEAVKQSAADAKAFIDAWVTTPVGNAWQWIKDTFWGAVSGMQSMMDTVTGWIRDWVTTPIGNAWQWIKDTFWAAVKGLTSGGGGTPGETPIPGNARGGMIGGRGSGTSDSNLAWVSRGEHIMPARAVRQPGVLAFLEALRRSGGDLSRVLDGMGRFAAGGLVMPAMASGGLGSMSHVTIQFPGGPTIGGLRASSDVVDELRKAAAMAQVRSGGRKPSRYT